MARCHFLVHAFCTIDEDVRCRSVADILLQIGSNGAQFPVAIDSGSFTLDIPLVGCNVSHFAGRQTVLICSRQGCTNSAPNNFYSPQNSSTSHQFTCSVSRQCTPAGATCHPFKKYCGFSNT